MEGRWGWKGEGGSIIIDNRDYVNGIGNSSHEQ